MLQTMGDNGGRAELAMRPELSPIFCCFLFPLHSFVVSALLCDLRISIMCSQEVSFRPFRSPVDRLKGCNMSNRKYMHTKLPPGLFEAFVSYLCLFLHNH